MFPPGGTVAGAAPCAIEMSAACTVTFAVAVAAVPELAPCALTVSVIVVPFVSAVFTVTTIENVVVSPPA